MVRFLLALSVAEWYFPFSLVGDDVVTEDRRNGDGELVMNH
jgi:hypothetical protein